MTFLAITIVGNLFAFLLEFYFDYRQSKTLQECQLPDKLAKHIDPVAFEDMQTYVRASIFIVLFIHNKTAILICTLFNNLRCWLNIIF